MEKYIYAFDEGAIRLTKLLGGKGAGLAEMTRMGFSVPSGFTITTEACATYFNSGENFINDLKPELKKAVVRLEKSAGKKFGDLNEPLFVSVRSGASVAMPGMMDTILNVGLNDRTVEVMVKNTRDLHFAYINYIGFLRTYGEVVLKIGRDKFEKQNETWRQYSREELLCVVERFKDIIRTETGKDFPQEPMEQLISTIEAVFCSWGNQRASQYRKLHNIPDNLFTAVNVQQMVYGNSGNNSGAGVVFSRNPITGDKKLYGEFLINAQGEDVVSGVASPFSIEQLKEINLVVYSELSDNLQALERQFKDMQDAEFTIENGKLYMLQARSAKRSILAMVKATVDLVGEGIISVEEAVKRVTEKDFEKLLLPKFDPQELRNSKVVSSCTTFFKGAVTGKLVLKIEKALKADLEGEEDNLIFLIKEKYKDDGRVQKLLGEIGEDNLEYMLKRAEKGIMRNPVVVFVSEASISEDEEYFLDVDGRKYVEGDCISVDGTAENIYKGELTVLVPTITDDITTIIKWILSQSTTVRTNVRWAL